MGGISSVSSLLARTGLSPEQLLSGPASLGALWEEAGYMAIPSPRQPKPGNDKYYRGGYIPRPTDPQMEVLITTNCCLRTTDLQMEGWWTPSSLNCPLTR